MTDENPYDRPICGHKYCPAERCGYMPEPISFRPKGGVREGMGTGLPNDVDYSDIELRALAFLDSERKTEPPKTLTVSGNRLTVTRLDPEGNPVGEPINVHDAGGLSFEVPADDVSIEVLDWSDRTFTMDFDLCEVDPELIALLTGVPPYTDIPTEVWSRPWWYRWLPRFLKRRLKSRWIRRGYGG